MTSNGEHRGRPPHIVGIGGTVRTGSSSEQALRIALEQAARRGATTACLGGAELASLPMYVPGTTGGGPVADDLVAQLRRADGVIVASPGYHGSISGLVKNALDYTEELSGDERPYLAGRAVGLVVSAKGWQGAVTTLEALRSIVHALRGWVTPYGAAINSSECRFADNRCSEPRIEQQLRMVSDEVLHFAGLSRSRPGTDSRRPDHDATPLLSGNR
ncbi:NADPH-dependent FMN reductase [Streptomyces sp. cg40]|uniref:NADPH-dependent FMN reductase n=1 Tax=Streptomyces sp. cg40 TaxID=3419764 RepID=UPI003D0179DF